MLHFWWAVSQDIQDIQVSQVTLVILVYPASRAVLDHKVLVATVGILGLVANQVSLALVEDPVIPATPASLALVVYPETLV